MRTSFVLFNRLRCSISCWAAVWCGCVDVAPTDGLPEPLQLVAVTADGPLDRLARVPVLHLHFNRAVESPVPDAVIVVTGEPSASLRADAAHSPLPPTLEARRVGATVLRDPGDPTGVTVRSTVALLPDTPLVLLLTPRLRGQLGGVWIDGDGGARAEGVVLQVAPAPACGPLGRVYVPDDGVHPPARMLVQWDLGVSLRTRGGQVGWTDGARTAPVIWSADCLQPDGAARCFWVQPTAAGVPPGVWSLRTDGLRGRTGLPASVAGTFLAVTTPRPPAPPVRLGPQPACVDGETARGAYCIQTGPDWLTVRAITVGATVLRVQAVPMDDGEGVRAGLSDGGVVHAVRVAGLRPGVAYQVTAMPALEAATPDPWVVATMVTTAALPPVTISEVLFHPNGLATQAYVELVNDGPAPVSVAGWSLRMGVKVATLPVSAVVPAHGRAVVTGAGFDPRGLPLQGDPPLAAGANWVALSGTLGAHGLHATGAVIVLEDAAGTRVSYVPGLDPRRPVRQGVGLVRADRERTDTDPAAWTWDAAGGATPGGPDRLR